MSISVLGQAYLCGTEMRRRTKGLTVSFSLVDIKSRVRSLYGVPGPFTLVTTDVYGGTEPHECIIIIPSDGNRHARYHCDCSDFQFTFYPYLESINEALKDFPVYVPTGRGMPRAINEYGMCKHLMASIEHLRSEGIDLIELEKAVIDAPVKRKRG